MNVYEVTISYRFDADNPDHAIEQFIDAIVPPDQQTPAISHILEAALTDIRELPNRAAP